MIAILEFFALCVFALIAFNIWKSLSGGPSLPKNEEGPIINGRAEAATRPALRAAAHLRAFENARAELKAEYPATFAMLGGYLNHHTIAELGGVEGAVREMLSDWAPRREEAMRELTRLLADNETEEEARAILAAACEADLSQDGARSFLTFLLGRFNAKEPY